LGHRTRHPNASTAPRRRKDPTIKADARFPQGDLILGLLSLLERNRLALVVLAASLKTGARTKAREAYADSAAARWLARNAQLVRHFLASLAVLRTCAGRAGYRALGRAQSLRRVFTAPRRLTATITARAPLAVRAVRGPGRLRPMVGLAYC
jgi:hypothetical protein